MPASAGRFACWMARCCEPRVGVRDLPHILYAPARVNRLLERVEQESKARTGEARGGRPAHAPVRHALGVGVDHELKARAQPRRRRGQSPARWARPASGATNAMSPSRAGSGQCTLRPLATFAEIGASWSPLGDRDPAAPVLRSEFLLAHDAPDPPGVDDLPAMAKLGADASVPIGRRGLADRPDHGRRSPPRSDFAPAGRGGADDTSSRRRGGSARPDGRRRSASRRRGRRFSRWRRAARSASAARADRRGRRASCIASKRTRTALGRRGRKRRGRSRPSRGRRTRAWWILSSWVTLPRARGSCGSLFDRRSCRHFGALPPDCLQGGLCRPSGPPGACRPPRLTGGPLGISDLGLLDERSDERALRRPEASHPPASTFADERRRAASSSTAAAGASSAASSSTPPRAGSRP